MLRLFPQASWTIIKGKPLPFIASHNLYPPNTTAQVTDRTGEKTFVKLLSPHSETPYGYLYDYEPVKTLRFYSNPPKVGEKLRYNNIPYEVLSVTLVPTEYFDDDDSYRPAHCIAEVAEI